MNIWLDRPVLITGATGLVGSYLTRKLLDNGAVVTAIIRDYRPDSLFMGESFEHCNIVKGDLLDRDLITRTLAEYEIDTVFHLAAQTVVSIANGAPHPTLDNNIRTSLNVMESCRNHKKLRHLTVASSDKAYGELFKRRQYVEKDPVQGVHPYDCSKSCTDLIAQTYIMSYDQPIAIARCGNIYGGGDMNWNRLIPNTIRRIIRGKIPVIWGTGDETRDYFYVEDTVNAYLLLSEKQAIGPYNFSTGEELTVKSVIETVCDLMDVPRQYDILHNVNGEIFYQWLDSTKARTNLGWKPQCTLKEGLQKTIEWYRMYLCNGGKDG
jgi:CDP-glucose 4,6-dehydratase